MKPMGRHGMNKKREWAVLGFMVFCYGLLSIRYFPAQPGKTIFETVSHVFSIAPVTLGATLVIVSLLQKAAGERLPWIRVGRIFLTVSLCVEILIGLSLHFQGAVGPVSG